MKTIHLNYPILLISDVHCRIEKIDLIRAKHPEIKNRVFLGDLFEFQFPQPGQNYKAGEWLVQNINEYVFVAGNHCITVAKKRLDITEEHFNLIANNFYIVVKIELPNNKNLICCHSKPNDLWEFINPGYTFREFEEDWACVDENTLACCFAHTHRPMVHQFQETDTKLWNIGAARDGDYGIITEKGIEFKKL